MSPAELRQLVHDVNAKCASLRSAAALLAGATPKDAAELLELMTTQAESLAQTLCRRRDLCRKG